MSHRSLIILPFLTLILLAVNAVSLYAADAQKRPNILIAISDDQSFPHTSFAGFPGVQTPAFDRIAKEGVFFRNAMAASPGCSPSRAALLTGRHDWQIEQAGTHASEFPSKYVVFTDLLEQAGYSIGMTGKGWGPGNYQVSGRSRNPAGNSVGKNTLNPPTKGIARTDYAENFKEFLSTRKAGAPFCFWFGGHEPHRVYEKGSGLKAGKKIENGIVPPFLPDDAEIRSDVLDYCLEVEWFDSHLAKMIAFLEAAGELDNTIIIVTADNGMPFPRAKANCYEYGIHVPMAIRWASNAPGGRTVDDVIGFVDITATILEAANVTHPSAEFPPSGSSILSLLKSDKSGLVDPQRHAYASRERHSSSRYMNWTYPQRALRTNKYLYIRNFRPDRWPAGDPEVLDKQGKSTGPHSGYCDIDGSPSLSFLIKNYENDIYGRFFHLAVDKRPLNELYNIENDPGCLHNIIANPAHADVAKKLGEQLEQYLTTTKDPRVLDGGDIWETYKRYSPIRSFPAP